MILRLLSLGSFIAILGCAHLLRKDNRVDPELLPPEPSTASVTADEKKIPPKNEIWFQHAQDGMRFALIGESAQACLKFSYLSRETEFPLRDWALVKSHEHCASTANIEPLETLTGESPYWFETTLLRVRLRHFDSLTPAKKIQALWDKARLETKDERLREQALMDALSIAEGLLPEHAEEARERLWKNSPRLQPNPPRARWRTVAADFRRWREFGRAVQIETRLLKSNSLTNAERFEITKSIRQTHKISQNKNEMLKSTDELVKLAEQPFKGKKAKPTAEDAVRLLEARVLAARTWWTENRRDLGRTLLQKTTQDLKGRVSFEEVYWLLGRMHEEAGEHKEALASYEASLQERPFIAGLREKTLWFKAWTLYKSASPQDSIAAFDALIAASKDGSEKNKAAYWRARSFTDESQRRQALLDLRKQDPLGFYGQLTYRDLNEPLPPLRGEAPRGKLNLWLSPEIPVRHALVTEWLLAVGEKDGPVRVLETLQSDLRRRGEPGADALLRVASAYARAGEFLPLFSFMGTLRPEMRDQLLVLRPDLLFPEPWKQEVDQAARETLVPAELIYAIMRQESAFNPRARSHAEAYGLMQLLHSVADQHARRRSIAYAGPEDLYVPETAIRLGASEIRGLMDKWQGQWIPAVASYNASEKAVRGWIRHRSRPDPVEFIEEIPYEETKGYVKLVMRNQIFYQRLLTHTPTPFPIKVLDLRVADGSR